MSNEMITIESLVGAPIEKVWLCWTEPAHITRWNFASGDWCCPSAENDLTPGGRYRARMEAKDGSFGFDFEAIYEPGSTTVTADLGEGWTQGLGPDTPMDDGSATYSDGSTGDGVDIPGWIGADVQAWIDAGGTYGRDTTTGNGQGSVTRQSATPDGLYYYLSNGGAWGNAAGGLIVSDAPLAAVEDGLSYTLSMLANGGATPVVLELLADGVALTPSSSVDPALSDDWQEFSRTYDAASLAGHAGASLTIRLGVGRGASGSQSHFDAVSLSSF